MELKKFIVSDHRKKIFGIIYLLPLQLLIDELTHLSWADKDLTVEYLAVASRFKTKVLDKYLHHYNELNGINDFPLYILGMEHLHDK